VTEAAEVLAEIRRILAEELEIARPAESGDELTGDLGVDSLGAIVLAVGLEDRFRVRLTAEDAGRVVTVGDLVDLVVGARASAPADPREPRA